MICPSLVIKTNNKSPVRRGEIFRLDKIHPGARPLPPESHLGVGRALDIPELNVMKAAVESDPAGSSTTGLPVLFHDQPVINP